MKLLPKEFTKGLRKSTGEFFKGVWYGMGPDIRRKSDNSGSTTSRGKRRKVK